MSKVPAPKISPGDAPETWEGLFQAAQELAKVRLALGPILDSNKQGFVSLNVRPTVLQIQNELERVAAQQFGLLGRLALIKESPKLAGTELLPFPSMVLAFVIHSAIMNAGMVCTGSGDGTEYNEADSWPESLPPGWLDDTGSKFSFKYRARSAAADRLVWKGIVMTDLLAISANDPYSSGKDAMTMHLRIKDFIQSSDGETPSLVPGKAKEVISIVQERILPLAGVNITPSSTSGDTFVTASSPQPPPSSSTNTRSSLMAPPVIAPGGFAGDLVPGSGGSMLFGPGNPQFDGRFGGRSSNLMDPRQPGRLPEARFDPYSPFGSEFGDPDPDHLMMPGNRRNIPEQFGPGTGNHMPGFPGGRRGHFPDIM